MIWPLMNIEKLLIKCRQIRNNIHLEYAAFVSTFFALAFAILSLLCLFEHIICTTAHNSAVQLDTTWRQPVLSFINKTFQIFRCPLIPLKNCSSFPTSPCFARGPWEKRVNIRILGTLLKSTFSSPWQYKLEMKGNPNQLQSYYLIFEPNVQKVC